MILGHWSMWMGVRLDGRGHGPGSNRERRGRV
jgi:hypothetical protein